MLKNWMKRVLINRTFQEHFQIEHHFHGIVQFHIKETYIIRPISHLGIQMLLDGFHISDHGLHLKAKITVETDKIRVFLVVLDPMDSQTILEELKRTLIRQLLEFEKRFYSNPVVQYVEQFCSGCQHYKSKPFNQCISSCHFQSKKTEKKLEMTPKNN